MNIDISKLPPGFKLELCKEDLIAFAEILLQKKNIAACDSSSEKPISAQEIARYLDCSLQHIYWMTSNKRIPHFKVGKRLMFLKSEINQWIKENRQTSQKDIDEMADAYLNKNK